MKEKYLADLIGKNVITLDEGQIIGYLLDAQFDEGMTMLNGFVVADEESERENFLPCNQIKIWGEDSVFVQTSADVEMTFAMPLNNPICKKVYDEDGNVLGRVKNVQLSSTLRITNFLLERCQLPIKNISLCGVNCLFFSKKTQKNSKKSLKTVNFTSKIYQKVQIENTINNVKIGQEKSKIKPEIPKKIILNPTNLLNKKAECDIFGLNNELIIKKGQKIDQNKIDIAKKHGKLNFLIFNSK